MLDQRHHSNSGSLFAAQAVVAVVPIARRLSRAILPTKTPAVLTWSLGSVCQRAVWRRGLQVLWFMAHNVLVAVLWTWLLEWLCSYGDVFSGRSPRDQRYGVFLGGTLMWIQLSFCLLTLVGQSALLTKRRFADSDSSRPLGFTWCFRVLLQQTYWLVAVCVGMAMALAMLSGHAPVSVRRLHLEFLVNCVLGAVFWTSVHLTRRQVSVHHTKLSGGHHHRSSASIGQVVQVHPRPQPQPQPQLQPPTPQQHHHQQRHSVRTTRFCRVFLAQNLPLLFSIFVAGAFVQTTSLIHVTTQRQLMVYASLSLVFKLTIQELAHVMVMGRPSTTTHSTTTTVDTRTIFLTVGLPTVLIDTQIRLAMQRLNSVHVTLSGAVVLSLLEVLARLAKVLVLRLRFRRRATQLAIKRAQLLVATPGSTNGSSELAALETQHQEWRQLHLKYHAAEVYADISAEYIAIGSCAAMLLLYWDHPHYLLGGDSSLDLRRRLNQPLLWLVQVGLEIVVDYVSVVLEIAGGIAFEELHRFRAFITLLFLVIALLNVQNSAVFFLIVHDN